MIFESNILKICTELYFCFLWQVVFLVMSLQTSPCWTFQTTGWRPRIPASSNRTHPLLNPSIACGWETLWEISQQIRTVQCHICVLPIPIRLTHRTRQSHVCPTWQFLTQRSRLRSIPQNSNHVTFHPSHQTGMYFERQRGVHWPLPRYESWSCHLVYSVIPFVRISVLLQSKVHCFTHLHFIEKDTSNTWMQGLGEWRLSRRSNATLNSVIWRCEREHSALFFLVINLFYLFILLKINYFCQYLLLLFFIYLCTLCGDIKHFTLIYSLYRYLSEHGPLLDWLKRYKGK